MWCVEVQIEDEEHGFDALSAALGCPPSARVPWANAKTHKKELQPGEDRAAKVQQGTMDQCECKPATPPTRVPTPGKVAVPSPAATGTNMQ